ncbi:hypothetical protein MLD38_004936 [Melastoma candidum]|uniref:Uncharacterized protein n=1 Tax=Melastoma candidum TaxID=119954 RepID=A0ACB9S6I1_9MYRT|nr:hypothetical protein MLD38_004936 [Melastoma candidum]
MVMACGGVVRLYALEGILKVEPLAVEASVLDQGLLHSILVLMGLHGSSNPVASIALADQRTNKRITDVDGNDAELKDAEENGDIEEDEDDSSEDEDDSSEDEDDSGDGEEDVVMAEGNQEDEDEDEDDDSDEGSSEEDDDEGSSDDDDGEGSSDDDEDGYDDLYEEEDEPPQKRRK